MSHIFLSYDNRDREFARDLVSVLQAAGWSVWWDRRIPTGQTWRAVLDNALEQMSCMIVLWSKRSIDSHWVIEEAEEGRARGKLLPLLIDDVRPPRGFREVQALSFIDWDRSPHAPCFRQLMEDIDATIGTPERRGAANYDEITPSPKSQRADTSQEAARVRMTDSSPLADKPPRAASASATSPSENTYSASRQTSSSAPPANATQRRNIAIAAGALIVIIAGAFIGRDHDPERVAQSRADSTAAAPVTTVGGTSGVTGNADKSKDASFTARGLGSSSAGSAGQSSEVTELQRLAMENSIHCRGLPAGDLERNIREMERRAAAPPKAPGAGNDAEFDEIKNDMSRLSKMQACLSDVLNEMDRKAKEAIRQIKAG